MNLKVHAKEMSNYFRRKNKRKPLPKKTFTIEEIREYLVGGLFVGSNGEYSTEMNMALQAVISELEDKEDGIQAVMSRKKPEKELRWILKLDK